MARDMTPVLKRCRSLGLEPALLGLSKKASKRTPRAIRKLSEYGLQLREKQKVKFIYGVLEAQFRNYYDKADQMSGITGENLLRLLEMRLDNVVFRLGYGRTRNDARQVVRHNHIQVNGKKVNIPSYLVKANDEISITEKSRGLTLVKDALKEFGKSGVMPWLSLDPDAMKGKFLAVPRRSDITDLSDIKEQMIIEYYSK